MSIGAVSISTNQRRETPAAPTVTAANQGTSLDGTTVQLGQLFGALGDPAVISADRQIPFISGNYMYYTESDYIFDEYFLRFTPTNTFISFDSNVIEPLFLDLLDINSGNIFQLKYDAALSAYVMGGNDDSLVVTSFTAFDGVALGFTPTALVHIGVGDSTAGRGQLKFESTTLLAAPEAGVIERSGGTLFYSPADFIRLPIIIGETENVAPATQAAVALTDFYGVDGTQYLAEPDTWLNANIGGVTYKIPCYVFV